jgi:outer membrane lipoprotein-sorting protein
MRPTLPTPPADAGREARRARTLFELAAQAVPDDLDLWPSLHRRLTSRAPGAAGRTGRRWRRAAPALLGGAAAAVALGLAGGLFAGRPQAVSAGVVFDRALAAADTAAARGVSSYHLTSIRQVPAKGNATITREVWYAGADRQRTDTRIAVPGAPESVGGTIFNGPETWFFSTADGRTRVVHTTGTTGWTPPAESPDAQGSVADLLARYAQKDCMDVRQQGEASVAGREAYVLVLTPRPTGCAGRPPQPQTPADATRVAAAVATKAAAVRTGEAERKAGGATPALTLGRLTVMVDKATFLPLRSEATAADGSLLDRYEVISVTYDAPLPAAAFTYTPPAGAEVVDIAGGTAPEVKATVAARLGG